MTDFLVFKLGLPAQYQPSFATPIPTGLEAYIPVIPQFAHAVCITGTYIVGFKSAMVILPLTLYVMPKDADALEPNKLLLSKRLQIGTMLNSY